VSVAEVRQELISRGDYYTPAVASHEYVSLACNDAETAPNAARFSPFRDKRLISIVGKFLPRLERSVFFAALCSRAAPRRGD